MNGEMFRAYVEQCLVPTLRRNRSKHDRLVRSRTWLCAKNGKPKAVALSSLDYPDSTHAQWIGDKQIVKYSSGLLHRCGGRANGACDAVVDRGRDGEGIFGLDGEGKHEWSR
jgi:hypothetical protein